jgi:hypothetical protein
MRRNFFVSVSGSGIISYVDFKTDLDPIHIYIIIVIPEDML